MRSLAPLPLLLLAAGLVAAERGAVDWKPSPAEPINYRGDTTGVFPGAKPPATWDEATGRNIAWRTTMPGYTCSSPIMVPTAEGDRVFTMADPDLLICCDGKTGEILWQAGMVDLVIPQLKDPKQQAAWREHYNAEWRWGALSNGKHTTFMDLAAKKLPKNDGLQAFVTGKRVKDTKGGATGIPTPAAAINEEGGGRTYEWFWCGNTFNPPVSDGERVYVKMTWGDTVACYDLAGKRLWARSFKGFNPKQTHTEYNTRELFIYQNLVYVAPDKRGVALLVLDAKTGRTVHEVKQGGKGQVGPVLKRGQCVTPVTIDGTDYLLTGSDGRGSPGAVVIRAKDAKVMGLLKLKGASGGRYYATNLTNFFVRGDILYAPMGDYYFKKSCGGAAFKLTKQGDTIAAEQLYHTTQETKGELGLPRKFRWGMGWRGGIVHRGAFLVHGHGPKGILLDAASGKATWAGKFYDLKEQFGLDRRAKVKLAGGNAVGNPIAANGIVYVPLWSGITTAYDVAQKKVVGLNRTEPMWSSGMYAHGTAIYLRGLTSLYKIGK